MPGAMRISFALCQEYTAALFMALQGVHGWSCPSRTGQTSVCPDRRGGPATKTLKSLPAQGLPTHGQMASHNEPLFIVLPPDILPPRRLLASCAIENGFACAARATRRVHPRCVGAEVPDLDRRGRSKRCAILGMSKVAGGAQWIAGTFHRRRPETAFQRLVVLAALG